MAVYTQVSFAAAAELFHELGLGRLVDLTPCPGGIENSNYFADTDRGRYVLTLFERLGATELPFYLQLMKHLAERGVPVPAPHAAADGELVLAVAGKPAAVVDRLRGAQHLAPDVADCGAVGSQLAAMHLAGADFGVVQGNLRGLDWWLRTVPEVLPHLDAAQAALMRDELDFQQHLAASTAYAQLPRGAIHGDLFRDNVMFDDGAISGVFDFYFAATDCLLFDLAVALNDWCVDFESGRLCEAHAEALLGAYAARRPLEGSELRLLPSMLRSAAFRFWLSRVWDAHLPRPAMLLKAHDPRPFERVLRQGREAPWHPAAAAPAP
ncbi:MAG: homoserine kinase [Pseudomonadota bacterium]|nr:homoserine kinase [Pseudomonadota bacterium]